MEPADGEGFVVRPVALHAGHSEAEVEVPSGYHAGDLQEICETHRVDVQRKQLVPRGQRD